MSTEQAGRHGNYDGQMLPPDVQFLIAYTEAAGEHAWSIRDTADAEDKIDGTLVTTADRYNDRLLRRHARRTYGSDVAVHSEEGADVRPGDHSLVVVGDPWDGSGQYGATHIDLATGKFLRLRRGDPVPQGAVKIEESDRSSCAGAAVFRNGIPTSAVVYGPYSEDLLVGDLELGGTYLNGRRIDLTRGPTAEQTFEPGMPYDFASWRGSLVDPRHLRRLLGREPNGTYSAIMQACDVLKGRSRTSVFTGRTRHDLVAGLMLQLAGGSFTDLRGDPVDWNDPYGAVYSVNPAVHERTIAAINAPRIDGLPPGYYPVGKEDEGVTAEAVLRLREEAGFGTEDREVVWEDALAHAHAFVGARETATGKLVLGGFLTGSSRHGIIHDIVTAPAHRHQGLATYAVDRCVQLARDYQVRGQTVGMGYVDVDLSIVGLGTTVPLQDCFTSHGFRPQQGGLTRDYRHDAV